MQTADETRVQQAAETARAALEALGLSDREKRFAEEEARRLIQAWLADGRALKQIRSQRLRPRTVPGVFAYALAGVWELYRYAMEEYPSRGA